MATHPFDPNGGDFAANIRNRKFDDTELRESLRKGWIEHFPALVDEHDVVLVGHRRLRLAKELGVKPVIKKLKLGDGDEADAERLRLAVASNIGAPLTKADRKHIALVLYNKHDWTEARIAEALGVSQTAVSFDLFGVNKSKPHAKTDKNPKGSGRPKGSKSKPKPKSERTEKADDHRERVVLLFDAGLTTAEIAAEVGIGERRINTIIRELRKERAGAADADETLSKSAQEKFDAKLRKYQHALDATFENRVREAVMQRVERYLAELKDREKRANAVLNKHKGIMPRSVYLKILKCLHPDRKNAVSDRELHEAMIAFTEREELLCARDKPVDDMGIPRTYAEAMAARQRAKEDRKRASTSNQSAVRR